MTILNLKVELGKSSSYRRLALFIYAFTTWLLFASAFVFAVKMLVLLLLFFQLVGIIKRPLPNPNYTSLNYDGQSWVLQTKTTQQLHYDKVRVIIDTGLFFLLELNGHQGKKLLVIFSDQLTNNAYRSLKIIEKIQ